MFQQALSEFSCCLVRDSRERLDVSKIVFFSRSSTCVWATGPCVDSTGRYTLEVISGKLTLDHFLWVTSAGGIPHLCRLGGYQNTAGNFASTSVG